MNSRIELPEVYSESLSYYQDISKLVAKMNELIKGYNAIPKYVIDEINEAIKKLPDPTGGTNDHTQLTNRDASDQHPQSAITGLIAALAAKYALPTGGIPESDLANAVQTSLGKADSAYQKPSSGIPSSDMSNAVQTSLGKADTALQTVPDLSSTYVTIAQAIADAGKVLGINNSGLVVPVSAGGGGSSYPEWRNITHFTSTQEVSQFIITQDDNSNPLNLHEFCIRIDFVQPQTPKTGTMYVEVQYDGETYKPNVCSLSYNTTTADHLIFYCETIGGGVRKAASTAGASQNITLQQIYGNHGDIIYSKPPMNQIRIFGADFGVGTVVSIIGR